MSVSMLIVLMFVVSPLSGLSNWAGNQEFKPFKFVEPNNLSELQQVIQQAKNEGKTIRGFGSRHSWSDIAACDGYMLKTDKLNKVLMIDKNNQRVRVEAGIKVKDLVEILHNNGLALANQPAILDQSIGGMIATGTHGTGHTGTIASFIKNISFIAGDGNLYSVSKKTNPKWYPALRVGMGSMGIIYAVTIQCVPAFNLTYETYRTEWDSIKESLFELHEKNHHFQCHLDPYSKRVVVEIWNRSLQETEGLWGQGKKMIRGVGTYLSTKLSSAFPSLNQFFVRLWMGSDQRIIETMESYVTLSGSPSAFYLEEEIAIEEDQFPKALDALLSLIKEYEEKNIFVSTILFRFVASEKRNYLSPVSGQNSVYISVITPVTDDYWDFFKDFQTIMLPYGGRPHWGKINFLTKDLVIQLYGRNFDQFVEVRKEIDPDGLFSNGFTKRVFGW